MGVVTALSLFHQSLDPSFGEAGSDFLTRGLRDAKSSAPASVPGLRNRAFSMTGALFGSATAPERKDVVGQGHRGHLRPVRGSVAVAIHGLHAVAMLGVEAPAACHDWPC